MSKFDIGRYPGWLRVLEDPASLRDLLDERNDAGVDYVLAGVTAQGNPFLVGLAGVYAETEFVLFGNPWDPEVEYGTGVHCDECSGAEPAKLTDLSFPVLVIAAENGSTL